MPTSDLFTLPASDARDVYERCNAASWSDRRLVASVGSALASPKAAPADSFVLHAPLELLARTCLLSRVEPDARETARRRIAWLGLKYAAAGDELPAPARISDDGDDQDLAVRLIASLQAGELDDVDLLAASLATRVSPTHLRRLLAPTVVTSLAAAAHGSIFLSLFSRVHADFGIPGGTVRGLLRDLARNPDWKLRWFEDPDETAPTTPWLAEELLDVPILGSAGNNSIMPVMRQAEDSGLAPRLLSGLVGAPTLDVPVVAAELFRIAAWSMLQEPKHHAYGWTHCLTMPQAVLALAGDAVDARAAVAVAATHVVGFRASMGSGGLANTYEPDLEVVSPAMNLDEALSAGPAAAAAYAWSAAAEPEFLDPLVARLASLASRHHDAHYAKYTLATFDAADADPSHRPLYLAAAAFLAAFWGQRGEPRWDV